METKVYEKMIELLSIYAKSKPNEQERIREIVKDTCKEDNTQLNEILNQITEGTDDKNILLLIERDYNVYCDGKDCIRCKYDSCQISCKIIFTYNWLKEHNKIK